MIEIDSNWFLEEVSTTAKVQLPASSIVENLPKDLYGSATMLKDGQLLFIGGLQLSGESNYDIIVFNAKTNTASVLSSKLSTDLNFAEQSYILEKGQLDIVTFLFEFHARLFRICISSESKLV